MGSNLRIGQEKPHGSTTSSWCVLTHLFLISVGEVLRKLRHREMEGHVDGGAWRQVRAPRHAAVSVLFPPHCTPPGRGSETEQQPRKV